MCYLRYGRVLVAALAALLLGGLGSMASARADVADYAFELVDQKVRQGSGAVITVRLVHKPSGRLVPDAVVFVQRADMAPHGMTATQNAELLPDTLPGYYRFEADLMMTGAWALVLVAKLPGEAGIVQTRLILKAVQ